MTIRPREYYYYNNKHDWDEHIYLGYSRALWDIMSLIINEHDKNNHELLALLKDIHKIDCLIDYDWKTTEFSNKEAKNENP